jgi:hypothetical protein
MPRKTMLGALAGKERCYGGPDHRQKTQCYGAEPIAKKNAAGKSNRLLNQR